MQVMYATIAEQTVQLDLPSPSDFVLPGVLWGKFDELFTPAYWCGQAWQHQRLGTYSSLRIGRNLAEEIGACLLGGFGMTAEIGLLAFDRLRVRGLLQTGVTARELEENLIEPLNLSGSMRRYRFPRQKARYLSACMDHLDDLAAIDDPLLLRSRLLALPGIGLKTASWIVRNHFGSDKVAVIDIHIVRAGVHMGLFTERCDPQRDYFECESAFLSLASALGVHAGMLDSLIWDYMRWLPLSTRRDGPVSLN